MEMKPASFESYLKVGLQTENWITEWLRHEGSIVLPAYEKEGGDHKGPRLLLPDHKELIVPDLLVLNADKSVQWFEAKHKTVFSWHRKTKKWVTGIDVKCYDHYLEVEKETGWGVWILFLHTQDRTNKRNEPWPCPTGLFGQSLEVLSGKINHKYSAYDKYQQTGWGSTGMVYWSVNSLLRICNVEDVVNISTLDNLTVV
mgnify:CR=1 FL=1